MHVEKALNSLEGVSASVTLDPPVASVEFAGRVYSDEELQRAVAEAGEYRLTACKALRERMTAQRCGNPEIFRIFAPSPIITAMRIQQ